MDLSSLRPAPNSKKKKKRVGRGEGSGHGKTSCRGHKGLGARSGGNVRPGFEGGQMPLMRRVPKRGFHSPFKKGYALVNLGQLEVFESGAVVGPEQLHTQGLIKNKIATVKILGDGKLTKALVVKAHKFSAKAAETITALGGKTETIADA